LGLTYILHGRVLLAQSLLGSVFLLATLVMAEMTVPFAGLLLAASSYFYMLTGMETSLFVFCLALTVHAYVKGKLNWLPVLCILCFLSRFEGGAIAVVIGWQCFRRRRFPTLRSFLPAILLVALYLFLNFHFYGALLPQSASAKIGQGRSGFWGRWPTAFLRFPGGLYTFEGGTGVYLLILLAWFGSRDPRMFVRNQVVIPTILLFAGFYIFFNIPNYTWYYAPFLYFLVMYATRLVPENLSAHRALFVVIFAIAISSCFYLHVQATGAKDYEQAGDWLSQHTPSNATVASVETGTLGWHCDRYIIDIVGLTTPVNSVYTAHRDFSSWFKARPDFVVVHPDGRFIWDRVALSSPEYTLLPVQFGDVGILERKTYASANKR
jgi:arabinofuranosyltransferase